MDEAGPDGWEVHRGRGSCKINKMVVDSAYLYIFILNQSSNSPYFSFFFLFLKLRHFPAIRPWYLLFLLPSCPLNRLGFFVFPVLPSRRSLFWFHCLALTLINDFVSYYFINFLGGIYQHPQIGLIDLAISLLVIVSSFPDYYTLWPRTLLLLFNTISTIFRILGN